MLSNRADELLSMWEARRESGQPVTAEELCGESPELLQEVRWAIHALQQVESRFGVPSSSMGGSAEGQPSNRDVSGNDVAGRNVNVQSRFQVERLHASGGLGRVFIAKDQQLNRRVAIKFPLGSSLSSAARIRFRREVDITSRLDHPGIVPVHAIDNGDNDRLPCYVMRFVEGQTLHNAIERRFQQSTSGASKRQTTANALASDTDPQHDSSLPPTADGPKPPLATLLELADLLQRFVAVCNITAFAHSRGIVHRDIKPANILLGDFGETLLLDWGLARILGDEKSAHGKLMPRLEPTDSHAHLQHQPVVSESLASGPDISRHELQSREDSAFITQSGQMLGTPSFASPEQLLGRTEETDERSDVYSLGATLFKLLTGESVFRGSELGRHLENVRKGRLSDLADRLSDVPQTLSAVCQKALSVNSQDRYQSAIALGSDIERFLRDEPVSIPCETAPQKALRWLRKHPKSTSGIVAGLLVGFTAAVASSLLLSQKKEQLDDVNIQLTDSNQQLQSAIHDSEASRDHAVAALRSLSDDVLATFLLHNRKLTGQQAAYLQRVVSHYEAFAQTAGLSVETRMLKTEGLVQCGAIHVALRDVTSAERELKTAIHQLNELSRESTDRLIPRRLVAAHLKLADCYSMQRKHDLVADILESATAILEKQLLAGQPEDQTAMLLKAQILQRRVRNETLLGWHDRAVEIGGEAESVLQTLIAAGKSDPEVILILATVVSDIERSLHEGNQHDRATGYTERAKQLWTSLLERYPTDPDCRIGVARSESEFAAGLTRVAKYGDAILACSRGIELADKAVVEFPTNPEYRKTLALLLQIRGAARRLMNERPAAAADLNRAFEIARLLPAETFDEPRDLFQWFWVRFQILMSFDLAEDRAGFDEFSKQLIADVRMAIAEVEDRYRPEFTQLLGRALFIRGALLRSYGRYSEAKTELRESIAILEPLTKMPSGMRSFGGDLKDAHAQLAKVHRFSGEPDEAEAQFNIARAMNQERWPDGAHDLESFNAMANLESDWGSLLDDLGRNRDAEAAFRTEITLRTRILELSPEFRKEQTMLAGAHCNLGNVLKSQAQLDVALEEYDQAIKLLNENLARNPLDSQTTTYLRNSRIGRAATLSRQSRFPEALTEFDLVRAAAPREFNASMRSNRATCLARTNPAEAVAEAKAIQPNPGDKTYSRIAVLPDRRGVRRDRVRFLTVCVSFDALEWRTWQMILANDQATESPMLEARLIWV